MALTSTTLFDIVGGTQTITFNNPSQIDQISFSNNSITFQACSTYNLAKSDTLLWFQYLNTFNNLLLINFPAINSSIGQIFPLCQFDLSETNVGVKKIIYTQTSAGTVVLTNTYLPIATSISFIARASPVTITIQEYFMTILMTNQFTQQVNLN
jgi:hypothetical protein